MWRRFLCNALSGYFFGFVFFGVSDMGKHRSRLKILEDILSVINGEKEVKKTHIMYRAYLSYNLLTRYLNDLVEASLIKCSKGTCYSLTEKGEKFLARFGEYLKIRESVEKQISHIENEKAALKKMCPNDKVIKSKSDV
jgi:predicted transcriptional regulator